MIYLDDGFLVLSTLTKWLNHANIGRFDVHHEEHIQSLVGQWVCCCVIAFSINILNEIKVRGELLSQQNFYLLKTATLNR